MNTRVIDNLRKAELFANLTDAELLQVARICKAVRAPAGHTIFNEGDDGDEMYVIHDGCVRVMLSARGEDGSPTRSTINTLYPGQCFGEVVLLRGSLRTATVVTAEPTTLIVLREPDFRALCESAPRIGYVVMFNLAQDLAYKLHSSNLLLRGNIRWRGDELGKR
ncbi:MAG: cyclic nucleotide-binding domain-containing protein [Chloroflexota bacterium]|nr:MAG: cyclic nucleotide-binding domain-containing protein [Chloroflexota bacterium]